MHRCIGRPKVVNTIHFILLNKMSLWYYNVNILITTATVLDIFCLLKRKTPKRFRSRVFLCIQLVRRKGVAVTYVVTKGSVIRQGKLSFGNVTESRHKVSYLNIQQTVPYTSHYCLGMWMSCQATKILLLVNLSDTALLFVVKQVYIYLS